MENEVQVPIFSVGTLCLILKSDHCFDLFDTFYVFTIFRNNDGYALVFENKGFSFIEKWFICWFGILFERLYKFNLNENFAKTLITLHHNVGTKYSKVNKKKFLSCGIKDWFMYVEKKLRDIDIRQNSFES